MFSPQSRRALGKAADQGLNIAVAINTKGLESDSIMMTPALADFDLSDHRPLDAPGTLGALKRKGSNKAERASEGYNSFFITAENQAQAYKLLGV